VRNGELVGVFGWEEQLFIERFTSLGGGTFRLGKEEFTGERGHFDSIVEGHAQRLTLSGGVPLYRRETP
jgi:hypothetical protein